MEMRLGVETYENGVRGDEKYLQPQGWRAANIQISPLYRFIVSNLQPLAYAGGFFCMGERMRLCWLYILLMPLRVYAVSLHYGGGAVELGVQRVTQPALVVNRAGTHLFGAMYTGTAPAGALHISYDGTEYWVGSGCAPGTYSPDGVASCRECGIGHYCTGGMHRKSCTYGAISCRGANHASDPAAPAGAPINTLMTGTEVAKYIPPTDISQWGLVSMGDTFIPVASIFSPDSVNRPDAACASGTIGPGTYMFLARYPKENVVDSISGDEGLSNAFIAVFDHPVSYRSIHGIDIFQHFIDTNHAQYENWTLTTGGSVGGWNTVNENNTNISNIDATGFFIQLSVFELK